MAGMRMRDYYTTTGVSGLQPLVNVGTAAPRVSAVVEFLDDRTQPDVPDDEKLLVIDALELVLAMTEDSDAEDPLGDPKDRKRLHALVKALRGG